MPDTTVLTNLLGDEGVAFCGSKWANNPAVFRSNPEWFDRLASLDVLRDPEQWLDRATSLLSFSNIEPLARSEARHRYLEGESICLMHCSIYVIPSEAAFSPPAWQHLTER